MDTEGVGAAAGFDFAYGGVMEPGGGALLSSDRELPRQLGIKESRKTPLFNGALECRLYRFEVFDRRAREAHDQLHQARHDQMRAARESDHS